MLHDATDKLSEKEKKKTKEETEEKRDESTGEQWVLDIILVSDFLLVQTIRHQEQKQSSSQNVFFFFLCFQNHLIRKWKHEQ